MKKPKRKRDLTDKKFKAAGIKPLDVKPMPRKGEWQVAREGKIAGKPKQGKTMRSLTRVSDEEVAEMARLKAGGMSYKEIGDLHGLAGTYVREAVNTRFVNTSKGREILKGVLLENAIATGVNARKKIDDLNGMQSVVAAGIMTQRFIDLDKHIQNTPATVTDFAEIASLSESLDELVKDLGLDGVQGPSILDVDAEVTREGD